jgi:hypothetical protein
VHEKLMLVRKNMGAHASYAFFRSAVEILETDECWRQEVALLDLFRGAGGIGWTRSGGWASAAALGQWTGVQVSDDGRKVVALNLSQNILRGKEVAGVQNLKLCMHINFNVCIL